MSVLSTTGNGKMGAAGTRRPGRWRAGLLSARAFFHQVVPYPLVIQPIGPARAVVGKAARHRDLGGAVVLPALHVHPRLRDRRRKVPAAALSKSS